MQDNSFLDYLLKNKYEKTDDLQKVIKSLSVNNDLKDLLFEFLQIKADSDQQHVINILLKIEENLHTETSTLYFDILFCLINSNKIAIKIIKDKNINLEKLRQSYQQSFIENKTLLRDYNFKPKKQKTALIKTAQTTRFAPEPAGCLHIGHVKALLVNYNLSKSTNGTFLLRFDDTNPEKRYDIFEPEIIKDLQILGIMNYKISHSSDYFDLLIEKAKFLITKNLAYCDDTSPDQLKQERMDGIESKNRLNSVNQNLKIFNEMINGKSNHCLRAKIDMSNLNKTMRDPVIYRTSSYTHYRCDIYKAFPTYDFVCPILDSIENVTTACRANEYRDRNEQYNWFLEKLELKNKPKIFDFAKLNFEDTVLSKRKIEELIKNKVVDGWDDPRLSTIRGIKRAGMDIEALKDYINLQGASNKTNTISWDKIWAMNKKAIDNKSPRFMGIKKDFCVYVELFYDDEDENRDYNKIEKSIEILDLNKNQQDENCIFTTKSVPLNKKNIELGYKNVIYDKIILISKEDAQILEFKEEFTLMNWGNCIIQDKIIENGIVTKIKANLNLNGDYKKTKNKISWISVLGSISVKIIEYDKTEKNECIWYMESAFNNWMKTDSHLQIERYGFLYVDKPYILNLVPFTKQKRTY